MNTNIKLAANFLKRCPSCLANLVRHLCDMTCGKDQSSYMKVIDVENGTQGKIQKEEAENIFRIVLSQTQINEPFYSANSCLYHLKMITLKLFVKRDKHLNGEGLCILYFICCFQKSNWAAHISNSLKTELRFFFSELRIFV